MSDDKKWKVDEETRKKMSESHRQAWEKGERKAPVTKLKEEKTSLQEELADVKSRLARLERRDARIREVFRRHREIVDKGRKAPDGNPVRSFMDDLMAAWEADD